MGSSAANTNGRTLGRVRARAGEDGADEATRPEAGAEQTLPPVDVHGHPDPHGAQVGAQVDERPRPRGDAPGEGGPARGAPGGVKIVAPAGEAPVFATAASPTASPTAPSSGPSSAAPTAPSSAPSTASSQAAPPTLVKPLLEQLEVELPRGGELTGELTGQARGEALVDDRAYLALKRVMDVVLGSTLLLLLSPLLALLAAAIKLEDGGPVFFFHTRVGKRGRRFRFWKFRSMCVDAEARREEVKRQAQAQEEAVSDRLRFKMSADPRVTRVGRVLRRFSLDELPQLVNVVVGDMSLVGPRPPIPEEVAQYGPRHLRRLEVEQGITCLWQVSGRNLLSFEQQVELDLEYARRRSLGFDVLLLARTIPAVLTGRGAC